MGWIFRADFLLLQGHKHRTWRLLEDVLETFPQTPRSALVLYVPVVEKSGIHIRPAGCVLHVSYEYPVGRGETAVVSGLVVVSRCQKGQRQSSCTAGVPQECGIPI